MENESICGLAEKENSEVYIGLKAEQPGSEVEARSRVAAAYERNAELLERVRKGDDSAVEELTLANIGLVRSLASRFVGRGTELEDLIQLGNIGLLKAIRTFDADRGTAFSTYAVPLIIGEIRRFLRDDGAIKVGRAVKRDAAALMRAREQFCTKTGREPRINELADMCGLDTASASAALDAASGVLSFSDPVAGTELTLEQTVSDPDDRMDGSIERLALAEAMNRLDETQRKIILLRYFRERSQKETADALGLTQVKISREEKKIFEILRSELEVK